MDNSKLYELVKKIPACADATTISPLQGGLTNANFRVNTTSSSYMMRISDPSTALLRINREHEKLNTERAWRAGVGAEVIAFLPEEGILLIRWIEAKTLHMEDFHTQGQLLPRIAAGLRTLHAGEPFQSEFHFPSVRKDYLQTVLSHNYFLPNEYLDVEPFIKQLEEMLSRRPEPLVPCNNDLLAENFMDDGEKIWIIDYEYSGQNEPSFEIGNLASELFLNGDQLTLLCDSYWGQHLPEKIYRAMAWSMVAKFGWILWASIQENISPLTFDFRSWGLKKWDSVTASLKGIPYQQMLTNLKKYNR